MLFLYIAAGTSHSGYDVQIESSQLCKLLGRNEIQESFIAAILNTICNSDSEIQVKIRLYFCCDSLLSLPHTCYDN